MSVMFKEQAQVVVLVKAVNSWCLWKPWICSLQDSDLWRVCVCCYQRNTLQFRVHYRGHASIPGSLEEISVWTNPIHVSKIV